MTPRSYRLGLRERIVLARADGYSSAEVAKLSQNSETVNWAVAAKLTNRCGFSLGVITFQGIMPGL